jgi:hypothetical protein
LRKPCEAGLLVATVKNVLSGAPLDRSGPVAVAAPRSSKGDQGTGDD